MIVVEFIWNDKAIEGERPVYETKETQLIKSRAEHVEFCLKMRGPSRKAKYYIVTDSEPVL